MSMLLCAPMILFIVVIGLFLCSPRRDPNDYAVLCVPILVLLSVVAAVFLCGSKNPPPDNIFGSEPGSKLPRIFLSVASYRDPACVATVDGAFSQAKHPSLLAVGVCEQNKLAGENCLSGPHEVGEVRMISIPWDNAKGPCYARYLCSTLYRGEELYVQVDSHTVFRKNWDDIVRDIWDRRPLDRCALTHYPPNSEDLHSFGEGALDELADIGLFENAPWINEASFTDGWLQFQAMEYIPPGSPYEVSRSIGAGFLVFAGPYLSECAYDPHLDFVFNGEELLHYARFFTHDIPTLAPDRCAIAHDYGEPVDRPRIWNDQQSRWGAGESTGQNRLNAILDGEEEAPGYRLAEEKGYALGRKRSIQSMYDMIDIDKGRTSTGGPFGLGQGIARLPELVG